MNLKNRKVIHLGIFNSRFISWICRQWDCVLVWEVGALISALNLEIVRVCSKCWYIHIAGDHNCEKLSFEFFMLLQNYKINIIVSRKAFHEVIMEAYICGLRKFKLISKTCRNMWNYLVKRGQNILKILRIVGHLHVMITLHMNYELNFCSKTLKIWSWWNQNVYA